MKGDNHGNITGQLLGPANGCLRGFLLHETMIIAAGMLIKWRDKDEKWYYSLTRITQDGIQ